MPLKPLIDNHEVKTYFRADNFDLYLETPTGHGAINSTQMIAFQEESQYFLERRKKVQLERSGKRSLQLYTEEPSNIVLNPKKSHQY